MDLYENWTNTLSQSFQQLMEGVASTLPRLLLAVVLLIGGWLLARIMAWLVGRSLRLLQFDKLMQRLQLGRWLDRMKIEKRPSELVGKFAYWIMLLLVLVGFSETLGLSVVSRKISDLINYLPNVLIALFILVVGLYVAHALRELVHTTFTSYSIKAGKLIGNIVFYALTIFICLTALDQLQFNIELLTSNAMILVGGISLAFALGYGLSAKEILPNMLSAYYSKSMFEVGQTIQIGDTKGQIVSITNISVVIKNEAGTRIIPAKKLVTEEVQVLE
ncbi:MAG: hypothetical protein D6730_07010 [Bacteroidetes bacterium]|nr:MAG: hypothetical protein D6730_07010 [Bacteroidota bacterium]